MNFRETIQDLIEEAKLRAVWWGLCVFLVTYFLSNTSKSMWMNAPIAFLCVSLLRILFKEVDFHRKVRPVWRQTYLSHLQKKQLSGNDPRLSTAPPPQKWKRKIDSPVVEAAINDFIDKILKDFVVDLWYSHITPDKEVPEQIRGIIMDALAEISVRVKQINLVDLLTKDIIDLVGDHLELYRRNQAAIGVDVMETLSAQERDEKLKYHLMASRELHPALTSLESEYKVLQQLVGGILAVVLKPREAQCPVVRSIAREIVTCLVLRPVLNLASPGYINELIETLFLAMTAHKAEEGGAGLSKTASVRDNDHPPSSHGTQTVSVLDNDHPPSSQGTPNQNPTSTNVSSSNNQGSDMTLADFDRQKEELVETRYSDWASILEAATQRRTEVLTPENLENLWTKGKNYKKRERKKLKAVLPRSSSTDSIMRSENIGRETVSSRHGVSTEMGEKTIMLTPSGHETQIIDGFNNGIEVSQDHYKALTFRESPINQVEDTSDLSVLADASQVKRSSSSFDVKTQHDVTKTSIGVSGAPIIPDFFSPNFSAHSEDPNAMGASNIILHNGRQHVPKLRCRVMGAYFEKLRSKSFAVYSIAVTDAENTTWFVKRRYSNFEKLHRYLKQIPNYTLHLPPKRIFSSSTEDAFVHQRCIQLDKYLQDILSIANVAEQHEVWDFLSTSSKNYSFGKSSSVMRTLAVNVDDAVDDIFHQFKGVSDGLMHKLPGSSSSPSESIPSAPSRSLSWHVRDIDQNVLGRSASGSIKNNSDTEDGDNGTNNGYHDDRSDTQDTGRLLDNESNSGSFSPGLVRSVEVSQKLESEKRHDLDVKSEGIIHQGSHVSTSINYNKLEDPVGMPPEWAPPHVSVPLLNLVDKVFQLKRHGWIRRQVFWISKQILHLVMDDAIDDWLLRQIHWLRKEDTVALGIRWLQNILWPGGTFFIKLRGARSSRVQAETSGKPFQIAGQLSNKRMSRKTGSFEEQLEAARRASDVKKIIYDGAPIALVGLIGHKQYKRCARDIYNFIQSNVCVKQLTYSVLELVVISIFPELQNLVMDVHMGMHEKMRVRKSL